MKDFAKFGAHGERDLGSRLTGGTSDCCVYALVDPRDETIRYIGKTMCPGTRMRGHMWGRGRVRAWCDEVRAAGMKPQLCIIEMCWSGDALSLEAEWIRRIGAHRLLNHDWREPRRRR
jgi:hypothetical protein